MNDPSPIVEGSPAEVRKRLSARVLVIRSTWFPTPKELRLWQSSGVPAYVRWLRDDGIEIGPRLSSMWAACFSPVLRGRMVAEGARTRIVWRRSLPGFTLGVIGLWAAVLLVWFVGIVYQLTQGHVDAGAIFWWCVLAGGTVAGPALGFRYGGPALDDAERWVRESASAAVEEDW